MVLTIHLRRQLECSPTTVPEPQFRHDPRASGHTATHAAISVDLEVDEVLAIAAREGWRALVLPRGGFEVIEFWIDNTVMIELLTPAMAADYLAVAPRRLTHRV